VSANHIKPLLVGGKIAEKRERPRGVLKMTQTIKSGLAVVFLVIFLQGNTLFAETLAQRISRAENLFDELEYLMTIGDRLENGGEVEAFQRWLNYMAGFSLGAYQLWELIHIASPWDYSQEMKAFLYFYQLFLDHGANRNSYLSIMGGQRSLEGKDRRVVINDFR
jgi:hypothetical protein